MGWMEAGKGGGRWWTRGGGIGCVTESQEQCLTVWGTKMQHTRVLHFIRHCTLLLAHGRMDYDRVLHM